MFPNVGLVDGGVHGGCHSIDMEERQSREVDFTPGVHVQPSRELNRVSKQVVVRQHCTLRGACRTSTILQQSQVFPHFDLDSLRLACVFRQKQLHVPSS